MFELLFWLLAILGVVALVRHDNRRRAQMQAAHEQQAFTATQPNVGDELIATRVEQLAQSAKDSTESEVLHRAAQSIRLGMQVLMVKGSKKGTVPTQVAQNAPSLTNVDATPASTKPSEPAGPSLAERSQKLIQNVNVLLYLGAFLIVIAAGTFVGSNYGSIDSMTKVLLLGLLTAAFYGSGLGLFKFTKRFQPAGVTFAAIGLLMVPLVGLAVQALLYDGQPTAMIWVITTAVALVMQIATYMLLRKSYIAYFAALTTVSLFQSLTATLDAPVYWYGWTMLFTSLVYILLARAVKDKQLMSALDTSAQVFVPLSVGLSVLGWSEFGTWAIGTQLVLTSAFYLTCAGLRNFDETDAEVTYLALATSLFPLGFSLVLYSRGVARWVIAALLLIVAISYVAGDKFAPEARHRPIYASLAVVLCLIAPFVPMDGHQGTVLAIGSAIVLVGHYVLTRRHEVYLAFLVALTTLPYLVLAYLAAGSWPIGKVALVYAVLAFPLAVTSRYVLRKLDFEVADTQDAAVVIWTVGASMAAFALDWRDWSASVILVSSLSYFFLALTQTPQLILGATASLTVGLLVAGSVLAWSIPVQFSLHLASAVLMYGLYRLVPNFAKRPRLMGAAYGAGLAVAYFFALSSDQLALQSASVLPVMLLLATSFVEREKRVPVGLAVAASYTVLLRVGDTLQWHTALSVGIWSAAIYTVAWLVADDRGKISRLLAVVGAILGFVVSFEATTPTEKWWSVLVGALAAGMVLAESYRQQYRAGKYLGSAIAWLVVLRIYDAVKITISQVHIQTTAAYLGALAYRQYQRHEKQAQDALTAGALFISTVPLAFEALNDTTGGYVVGIMTLGVVLIIAGMGMHYRLVRDWGIGTLVLVVLYKTADFIFKLPGWVWFGAIGVGALVGAVYLLGRHPHDESTQSSKK